MDEAVDQVMGRSSSETGADKAVAIRRSQQKERARLQQDITQSQQAIAGLNEQRAPIAAEVRKVEAEVGPIKYIAAFVYGDTDQTILEKAVTWVIITLIVVFDPMAVILLLASQISFQNFREREDPNEKELQEFADVFNEVFEEGDSPLGPEPVVNDQKPTVTEPIHCHKCGTELVNSPGIGLFCPNKECDVLDGPFADEPEEEKSILEQHPYLTKGFDHFENLKPIVYKPEEPVVDAVVEEPVVEVPKEESLFVQNEEQKESNLWTTTTAESITPEEYMRTLMDKFEQEPKVAKLAAMVKTGRMDIDRVPEELREEVKKKLQ
jgi:hypothetical protein